MEEWRSPSHWWDPVKKEWRPECEWKNRDAMNDLCETCGVELHDDNHEIECACGEVLCHDCIHEHNAGCAEYAADVNDKWGPTTVNC